MPFELFAAALYIVVGVYIEYACHVADTPPPRLLHMLLPPRHMPVISLLLRIRLSPPRRRHDADAPCLAHADASLIVSHCLRRRCLRFTPRRFSTPRLAFIAFYATIAFAARMLPLPPHYATMPPFSTLFSAMRHAAAMLFYACC